MDLTSSPIRGNVVPGIHGDLPSLLTWVCSEVGIYEPLVVTIDGPCHAWPRLGNAQGPRDIATLHNIALQMTGDRLLDSPERKAKG